MKKLVFLSAVLVMLVSLSAQATGVRSEFNTYEIESVDDLYMGKKISAIWTINYNSDESPITVVKRKSIDGTEYVVHSRFFEVSYVSGSKGFGAKEVKNAWRNVPKKISCAVLSADEMQRQQIITPNKVDDKEALGLIASYLPDLLNDGYTHLLN